jgi:hypothetical protein
MNSIIRTISWVALASSVGGCWSGVYENNAAQYFHRSDTITLTAGNAADVNAATHVIDPWPRYVGNRHITANGERMVGAVQRYQRSGAARTQGQIGQAPGAPGSSASTPPLQSSGAATPSGTLPY